MILQRQRREENISCEKAPEKGISKNDPARISLPIYHLEEKH
jgi:hypothetical protein